MWVGEDGRVLGSVTIGGCVDGRVIEEAPEILRSGTSRLLSMDLGDEDARELGLTCAGSVDILLEPLELKAPGPTAALYERLRSHVNGGGAAVLATRLDGSAGKLVVYDDGRTDGSLGTAELDAAATIEAGERIRRGTSRTRALGQAELDVFFEVHAPPPTLIIFGAGHVAMPIVEFAHRLGLRTVVVDGRERFANRDRFPDADEVRVGIPSEVVGELGIGPSTFVVLVAHDYKYDIPVLEAALDTDAIYIGMLGSKRRGATILEMLTERGVTAEALDRVHVPIGLDIGAETAAELAISILAEALAVRAGRGGGPMRDRSGT